VRKHTPSDRRDEAATRLLLGDRQQESMTVYADDFRA
jgi:hypothetical protein